MTKIVITAVAAGGLVVAGRYGKRRLDAKRAKRRKFYNDLEANCSRVELPVGLVAEKKISSEKDLVKLAIKHHNLPDTCKTVFDIEKLVIHA